MSRRKSQQSDTLPVIDISDATSNGESKSGKVKVQGLEFIVTSKPKRRSTSDLFAGGKNPFQSIEPEANSSGSSGTSGAKSPRKQKRNSATYTSSPVLAVEPANVESNGPSSSTSSSSLSPSPSPVGTSLEVDSAIGSVKHRRSKSSSNIFESPEPQPTAMTKSENLPLPNFDSLGRMLNNTKGKIKYKSLRLPKPRLFSSPSSPEFGQPGTYRHIIGNVKNNFVNTLTNYYDFYFIFLQ
jgi:hypothetical protein